jgi:site-specific DNA recombinase
VIRLIYHGLAYAGDTLLGLTNHLNEMNVAPPKKSRFWDYGLMGKLVRNPLYKGEFAAHCWYYKKVWSDRSQRMVTRKFERPEEEWIVVPVPAIVSEETWSLAQKALEANRSKSSRNTHYDYLLVNMLTCAECGRRFSANTRSHHKGKKTYLSPAYRCTSKHNRPEAVKNEIGCTQSQISAKILDPLVWEAIMDMLTQPDLLTEAMDEYYASTGMGLLHSQVEFIEGQIQHRKDEDDKLYKAYMAGAFDEQEFADRRGEIRKAMQALQKERELVDRQIMDQEEFYQQRGAVSDAVEELRSELSGLDVPFDMKRRILRTIVDEIVLDVNARRFEIKGMLRGTFSIPDGRFVSIPGDRDSWRRSVESLSGTSTSPSCGRWSTAGPPTAA